MNVKITVVPAVGIPRASRLEVHVADGFNYAKVVSHLMDLTSGYALYDLAAAFRCVAQELEKLYEKQNPRDPSSSTR